MPLVSMTTLMQRAVQGGYGVGYFEAWDGYSLEAVCEAAEEERSPVILGFGGMMTDTAWLDNGGVEMMAGMGRAVAEQASVPVALLLNEAQNYAQAVKAMESGFNAVMLDTWAWPDEEEIQVVRRLTREAHARGVAVEAEFGRLPDAVEGGIDDSHATLTDPDEAAAFVEQTGVDCLAVSVGNVHILADAFALIDEYRLEEIHRRVPVPLVIHGGTGFPPEAVPHAIAHGVAKFNVGTALKHLYLAAVRETLGNLPPRVNVHDLVGSHKEADFLLAGKQAVKAKVRELIQLYGSDGHAED